MNTVKEKGYAKVNLFLDVLGKTEGFHDIDTVVATVNLFDTVSVTKRKDDKIVLRTTGGPYTLPKEENNNAYKAAKLFQDAYNTGGVDISVTKRIPVGGGLGGSSADISATLNAMKKLFGIEEDVKPLADSLGSDSGYMLKGGFARLTGRGEKVEFLDFGDLKLHLIIAVPSVGVSAKEAYEEYDKNPLPIRAGGGEEIIKNLSSGKVVKGDFYNALYDASAKLNPKISGAFGLIASLSPEAVVMSGSGSACIGIFSSKELCEWAKDKLKTSKLKLFVTETLTRAEISKPPLLKNPFTL